MDFDTKLGEIFKSTIGLSLEFIEEQQNQFDEVYIYGNLENNTYFFNLFYKKENTIFSKEDIARLRGFTEQESIELIFQLLDIGISDLVKISSLFKDNDREIPTELKVSYNINTHSFNLDISYDRSKEINNTNISNVDLFEEWQNEIKNKIATT